jgi:hypothetical protein
MSARHRFNAVKVYSDESEDGHFHELHATSQRRTTVLDLVDRAFRHLQSPAGKAAMIEVSKRLIQAQKEMNRPCLFDPTGNDPNFTRLPAAIDHFIQTMVESFPAIRLMWVDDGEAACHRNEEPWAKTTSEDEFKEFKPSDVGHICVHRNVGSSFQPC